MKIFKFDIIFKFQTNDVLTKEKWETPNHNIDRRIDDWHGPGGVKEQILSDVSSKLKDQLGHNCNIEINNGEIIIVSQRIDENSGKKTSIKKRTGLEAEDYFDKIVGFLYLSTNNYPSLKQFRFAYAKMVFNGINKTSPITIVYVEN